MFFHCGISTVTEVKDVLAHPCRTALKKTAEHSFLVKECCKWWGLIGVIHLDMRLMTGRSLLRTSWPHVEEENKTHSLYQSPAANASLTGNLMWFFIATNSYFIIIWSVEHKKVLNIPVTFSYSPKWCYQIPANSLKHRDIQFAIMKDKEKQKLPLS